VTGADRLARHYRRLLWAYPRRYRRERGAELVTTLLDDATPGQLRPTVAEARDLVAGGLRARLRPPRHPFARLVAAQVALYAGVLGAAAGVLLSGYPGPPDGAAAVAAATIAVPERPLARPGPAVACDMICPGPAGDGAAAYRRPWDHTDTVLVGYRVPAAQLSTVVTRAADVRAAAAEADLLHVAAHGRHEPDNPLLSHLDLADGPLFGYELERLARLPRHIVLSACELGLVHSRPGDETLGMTAALLHAGAGSVVAGVARVGDAAAHRVAVAHHVGLRAGRPPAEALADALAAVDPEDDPPALVCFGAGW